MAWKPHNQNGRHLERGLRLNELKILWRFQVQTHKMVMVNQPDIVKCYTNIKKMEQEMLKKYRGLKEELEEMRGVKATVVAVGIGALSAVTPKLGEWLLLILGTTSEMSV